VTPLQKHFQKYGVTAPHFDLLSAIYGMTGESWCEASERWNGLAEKAGAKGKPLPAWKRLILWAAAKVVK
jgi:hypothetical protein